MLYLYRIKFQKSGDELNKVYEELFDEEKDIIVNLDVATSFDYETDSKYCCYLLTNKKEIKSYKKILDDNLIPYICENISKDVIDNLINIENEVSPYINSINIMNCEIFLDEISNWIYKNLDLDQILDRINRDGIGSLREIDKHYLTNYDD